LGYRKTLCHKLKKGEGGEKEEGKEKELVERLGGSAMIEHFLSSMRSWV
jgi:hypothetical protein